MRRHFFLRPTSVTSIEAVIFASLAISFILVKPPAARAGGYDASMRTFCDTDRDFDIIQMAEDNPGWKEFAGARKALDRIRSKVEEWGMTTISAPVAVLDGGAFAIPGEIITPDKLLDLAIKERGATAFQSTEIGINNQFGLAATPTLGGGLAMAPASGTTTSTTTTTAQTTAPPLFGSDGKIRGSLNAEGLELPPAATAAQFGFGNVTAPFSLAPNLSAPTGGLLAAFRRTDNILIEQKIFSQMSKPRSVPGYLRVFFCVVQVSCNPGWRTKGHYIADCSASLEYYDFCERSSISRSTLRAPTVFSVLPLIDAQTVEMGNSQREVTQLAFQLAASLPAKGVDVKAKDLFQFVKRYSRDLRSVTPIPVVNSYSSGGTFGFRFSPSFQALSDPAQKKARAANVLLPTTFPALITVLVHSRDLLHASAKMKQPTSAQNIADGKLPEGLGIMTHISNRWYLKDRPPLYQFYKRIYTPMKRDTVDIESDVANDLAIVWQARADLRNLKLTGANVYNPAYENFRRQILELESKGVGRSWPIDLSGDALSKIDSAVAAVAKKSDAEEKLVKANAELEDAKKKLKDLKEANDGFLKEQNDKLWQLLLLNRSTSNVTSPTNGAVVAPTSPDIRSADIISGTHTPHEIDSLTEIDGIPVRRAIPTDSASHTASVQRPFDRLPFPLEPALPE